MHHFRNAARRIGAGKYWICIAGALSENGAQKISATKILCGEHRRRTIMVKVYAHLRCDAEKKTENNEGKRLRNVDIETLRF